MVQINFGELINDARGKIAGVVYSKNKSGAYIRSKVTPSNPQTSYQSEARSRLSNFAKMWADLTDTQRASWNEFAKMYGTMNPFGAKKPINGLSAYIRANAVLDQAAQTALTSAPADNIVEDLATVAPVVDFSDQKIFITGTPDPLPANHLLYVSVSPVVPAGREFVKNLFRFVDCKALASPTEIVWPAARLGAIAVGDKVFVKVQVLNKANAAITTGTITRCIVQA